MSLLQVERLTKRFGGLEALKDVSMEVRQGEVLGLIGPNGAGKTTLFNVVSGHLRPSQGLVRLEGAEIQNRPPHELARRGIARTFQIPRPFSDMTVGENTAAGLGVDFYPSAKALISTYRSQPVRGQVGRWLEMVGLGDYRTARADTLPIGMHRRLEIARALALRPRLLLLDEPTAGLTHAEVDQLADLLQGLSEQGITLVVIEHNMPFAMDLCQRIVVLSFGQVIAEGSPDAVRNDPQVIEAYLGKPTDA